MLCRKILPGSPCMAGADAFTKVAVCIGREVWSSCILKPREARHFENKRGTRQIQPFVS